MNGTLLGAAFGGLALCGASTAVSAHVLDPVTIDFQGGLASAVYGHANLDLGIGGVCGPSACYIEDGFVIGVVSDPDTEGEHLHRAGLASDRKLAYHADSTGIYVRAVDGHEFSLLSMDFNAATSDENPDTGPGEVWEILGFNTAVNPDLATGNGTDYATRIAYQTVANGSELTLTLDESFHNINAFWIHYMGFPGVPGTEDPPVIKDFSLLVDNIKLGPAVEPVPLPAAAWLLGSGLAALGAVRRRRGVAV